MLRRDPVLLSIERHWALCSLAESAPHLFIFTMRESGFEVFGFQRLSFFGFQFFDVTMALIRSPMSTIHELTFQRVNPSTLHRAGWPAIR
jgi:hypothetical protein